MPKILYIAACLYIFLTSILTSYSAPTLITTIMLAAVTAASIYSGVLVIKNRSDRTLRWVMLLQTCLMMILTAHLTIYSPTSTNLFSTAVFILFAITLIGYIFYDSTYSTELVQQKISRRLTISKYLLIGGLLWLAVIMPVVYYISNTTSLSLGGILNYKSSFYIGAAIGSMPLGVAYFLQFAKSHTALHLIIAIVLTGATFCVANFYYILLLIQFLAGS